MTQYLLSVWHVGDYPTPPPDQLEKMMADVGAFNAELQQAGMYVFAGGLQPRSSATVLRVAEGGVTMTDGPFAESKEQMGGFWIIEAPDLDVALEWATKGATACQEVVEVRPFQGEDG